MQSNDPNRPEIITRTAFGGKSAVALGGNRYSTKSEALYRAANMVAIPARGLVVDAALWVGIFAVLFRVPFSLLLAEMIPPYMAVILAVGVFLPAFGGVCGVFVQLPDHRIDCAGRVAMMLIGLAVATNGLWIRGLGL